MVSETRLGIMNLSIDLVFDSFGVGLHQKALARGSVFISEIDIDKMLLSLMLTELLLDKQLDLVHLPD